MSASSPGKRTPDPRTDSLRLFFALLPDPAARETLAARALDIARETGGRATPAENLHVTLAFLGNVARSRIADMEAAGARAAAGAEAFPLLLDRVGWFRHAGVAWVGPDAVAPPLQQAFAALRDALHEAGFAPEARPFNPHLTLARRCARAPAAGTWSVGWHADAMALMASQTLPGGPVYRVLRSWRLGERGGPVT